MKIAVEAVCSKCGKVFETGPEGVVKTTGTCQTKEPRFRGMRLSIMLCACPCGQLHISQVDNAKTNMLINNMIVDAKIAMNTGNAKVKKRAKSSCEASAAKAKRERVEIMKVYGGKEFRLESGEVMELVLTEFVPVQSDQ